MILLLLYVLAVNAALDPPLLSHSETMWRLGGSEACYFSEL